MATISICRVDQCTGCAACHNICPEDCIQMVPDAEGFLYPEIDRQGCTECGACINICPSMYTREPERPINPKVYAAWNRDPEIRFYSSSGGVFSALAEQVLDQGGVVFGAAFDENMKVKHVAVKNKADLYKLRGSKYVQSDVGMAYRIIRDLIKEDRMVLFSGTPCQIAGLYAAMGKTNDRLLTCDLVCAGVPSRGLFGKYVKYLEDRFGERLLSINFRHKRDSWQVNSKVASLADGREVVLDDICDSFMYGFATRVTLRPSCHQCSYMKTDRIGDVTIGDFWGIGELVPFGYDTKDGVSLILANSEKGDRLVADCAGELFLQERSLQEARLNGHALNQPWPAPDNRKGFFRDYQRLEYEELAEKYLVDKGLKRVVKWVIPRTWIFRVRKQITHFKRSVRGR